MKIQHVAAIAAIIISAPALWAQGGGTPATASGSKVGVLNVQAAIASTGDGKQAASELQAQFTPRQNELEQLSKQIDDLRARLRSGTSTLSDDEKARLAQEGDQKSRTYQRKQQELQDDVQEAQREVFDRIGRKMVDILDKYSKDNGYGMIIDSSSQNSTVVYAAPQIDITQDIVRLYDQAYPAKASGAAPPATPRSTAPSTQKPAGQPQKP